MPRRVIAAHRLWLAVSVKFTRFDFGEEQLDVVVKAKAHKARKFVTAKRDAGHMRRELLDISHHKAPALGSCRTR